MKENNERLHKGAPEREIHDADTHKGDAAAFLALDESIRHQSRKCGVGRDRGQSVPGCILSLQKLVDSLRDSWCSPDSDESLNATEAHLIRIASTALAALGVDHPASEDKDPELLQFLVEVAEEVQRARKIHPGPRQLDVALFEEVGEVAKEILEEGNNLRGECVQVACVAARLALEYDKNNAR